MKKVSTDYIAIKMIKVDLNQFLLQHKVKKCLPEINEKQGGILI